MCTLQKRLLNSYCETTNFASTPSAPCYDVPLVSLPLQGNEKCQIVQEQVVKDKDGILTPGKYEAGDLVFIDQFFVSIHSQLSTDS